MSVLICKNISSEGPGTIEDYLRGKAIPYIIVDLYKGESLPEETSFDTLVLLGGPMSVNDDIPYIRHEEELVRNYISRGKRILGVCLGAQIIAKALGARVYKGPAPEIGWLDITLCDEGLNDSLMGKMAACSDADNVSKKFKVFHWHGETFDIPNGALRLASSEIYPNQAFRSGANAYAFQFHIEVNEQIIYDWMSGETIDMNRLKEETLRNYAVYRESAFAFYKNFFVAYIN
ncbi:MAG TPA: type 1 glutamine amidotransferase [Dissulfurispiraceae bacterium]|nr:type 1 glutamine amidotransferase [Dissulfurispiraceae bacterium]